MAELKVYIAPGHGGNDPGAVANGLKEKDLTLAIGKYCRDYLKKYGVTVKMSRTTDVDPGLNNRCNEANRWGADLVVEVHINAGRGDGFEVYHSIYGGKGKEVAKAIETEVKKLGQNSRGLKTKANSSGKDYFGIIRMTKMPAVLVECAFIDTKKDIAIIDTKAEQKAFGEAIAKGILKKYGITTAVKQYKTLTDLNFRESPSLDGNEICVIPEGKTLTGTVDKKGWLKTTYNGKTGYVRQKGSKKTYCKEV